MRSILLLIQLLLLATLGLGQSARKYNREGNAHLEMKEFAKAASSYNKALRKNSSLTEASYNLGLAFYRQKKYNEAILQYKDLSNRIENKEILARVYHNLGNSHLQVNNLKESIEAYQNALRLNDKDEDTRYNLSFALIKLKARQQNEQKKSTQDLLNHMEQLEENTQQYMRRDKNKGKEVKEW